MINVYDEESLLNIFSDYISFSKGLYDLDKSNIDEVFNFATKSVENLGFTPIDIIRHIDKACEWNHSRFIHYISLFEQIYQKYPIDLSIVSIAFDKLSEYIISKYKIKPRTAKEIQETKSIKYSYSIHEEEIINCIIEDDFRAIEIIYNRDPNMFHNEICGRDLLCWTAYYGAINCFKFLIINDISITLNTLECAFIGGDFEIIQICEQKFQANKKCIENAIGAHNNEAAYYLEDKYQLRYSFRTAALSNNLEAMIKKLFNTGRINNCFPFSCCFGLKKLAECLLEMGADINSVGGPKKRTALIYSCIRNDLEMARFLLSKSADIEKNDLTGLTPMMSCAMYDSDEIAKELIARNVDLLKLDRTQRSAIQWCAWTNSYKVAKILLEHDVNTDEKWKGTMSLLDIAKYSNAVEMIKLLEAAKSKSK